jgi:hypothetical protein
MEAWAETKAQDIRSPVIQAWLVEEENKAKNDEGIRYNLDHQVRPLYHRLLVAAQQRSGFAPLNIIDLEHRSERRQIYRYFDLKPADTTQLPLDQRPAIAPQNIQRFFSLLFSNDPQLQQDALHAEEEHLHNHQLDTESCVHLVQQAIQFPHIVTVSWLERLAPYLPASTLDDLVFKTDLFGRLQQARQATTDSDT